MIAQLSLIGINSAPAIWQKVMATVLQGCRAVYYLQDILVTGETREEHTQNLKNVLSRLQKFGLRLNEGECKFFHTRLQFLGHVVISPTEQRVANILQAPTPKTKSN